MTTELLNPLTIGAGEAQVYDHLGGEKMTILLSAQDTGGAFAMFIDEVPPEVGPPLHIHHNEDETFYILEGDLDFQVNEQAFSASAGTVVFLPKGIPHTFRNAGTQTARALVTVTPGGLEGLFAEAEPLATQPEPDMPALLVVAAKYGIEALLPGQSNASTSKTTPTLSPVVVRPGEGSTHGVPDGETITVLLRGEQTGGNFALLYGEFLPGNGAPLHLHHREDETFYILEGSLDMQVGQSMETASAGAAVFRPREIPHDFHNTGDQITKAIALVTPAGFENYFADFYGLMGQGKPDMQEMLAVAQKYGMEINL